MSQHDTNDDQQGTQMPDTESKDDQPTHETQPPPTKVVTWSRAEMEERYWDSVERTVRASIRRQRGEAEDTNQKEEG